MAVSKQAAFKRVVAGTILLLSAVFPATQASAAESVAAGTEPSPSAIELRPFAQVPNNSFGTPPRLNSMAVQGDRLFVVEDRDGLIYELTGDPADPSMAGVELYLDVAAAIEAATDRSLDRSNLFHGGVRAVAFHPEFARNGLLYVSLMETKPANPAGHQYLSDPGKNVEADSVVVEFTASLTTGVVDPLSYREVLRVGLWSYDHAIKQVSFNPHATPGNPDYGLLYIAHGDGSLFSSVSGTGMESDGLGKILRIDPLAYGTKPYAVPADNPFVGDASMLDEVFSLGHRNPHHLAFAPMPGGTLGGGAGLLVAEPGRDNAEEINLVEAGANYGWPLREGTFVHNAAGLISGVSPLPANEASLGLTYPATQYGHQGSVGATETSEAVAGGYGVTNGSDLDGWYFYADFPTSGRLFHSSLDDLGAAVVRLNPRDPGQDAPGDLTQAVVYEAGNILFDHDLDPTTPPVARTSLLDVFNDADSYRPTRVDVRFGQGPDGELYVMSKRNNMVYLVVNSVAPPCRPLAEAQAFIQLLTACDYNEGDAEVLRLYRAFFDREPEVGGAKYWLQQRRGGVSFDQITGFFASSPEFNATYGQVSDEVFLKIIYMNALGREYDQSGFDYWLDRIQNEGLARHLVVRFIAGSPEFVSQYGYWPK